MSRTEAIKSVLQKQPLPIFLIIYSFLFLLLVGTLFLYHVYLIFNDTSTVEQRKILSFRKAEWKKHFQTKYWYSLKKKFLCLIPQPLMNFREPIYFKETKKFIFIKENKKDSESVTQIANAKDARTNKNVETNIIDFQSFNKQDIIQEQGILQQPAFVKDLKIIENKDDNKVCIKGICVEDVKEEILNAQPLNLFSKNRSLQLIEIGNYHHIENYKQE